MDVALNEIAELKALVTNLSGEVKALSDALTQLSCQVLSSDLLNEQRIVDGLWGDYLDVGLRAQMSFDSAKRTGDFLKEAQPHTKEFILDWAKKTASNDAGGAYQSAVKIHQILLTGPSPTEPLTMGALHQCTLVAYTNWKAAADTLLDDRGYYQQMRQYLLYYITLQSKALRMMQVRVISHKSQQLLWLDG